MENKKIFKCKKCGNCCKVDGYVHISEEDIKKISDYLSIDIVSFKKQYVKKALFVYKVLKMKKNGECIFLINNKCAIYKARPIQCRTFPFWKSILNDNSEKEYVKTYCPASKEYFD